MIPTPTRYLAWAPTFVGRFRMPLSRWGVVSTLPLVVLTACMGPAHEPVATTKEPPPDSVKISDDVFMAPVGTDASGCQLYTAWSGVHAVLTVIQYQRADGSFTSIRTEADCPPDS